MTRSSRQKEKYHSSRELSEDTCNVGSAARTRPFSFEEIMLRRKNKKQPGDFGEVLEEAGTVLGENLIAKVSDPVESVRDRRKDYAHGDVKHASEDFVKVSSRKKEVCTSLEEGKMLEHKIKESRKSESKSKNTLKLNSVIERPEGSMMDERDQGKRKSSKVSYNGSEKEHERRHLRDLVMKDKHADRNRGNMEKESKRQHRNEDGDRTRDRNASKKHDSYKSRESKFAEKKEKESTKILNEDSRQKRRRSRSRDHAKDSKKRSVSLSPRVHKRMSYDARDHVDVSTHSSKDRSGRSNADFDRMRMSGNGSSSHHRRHSGSASRLGGYSPRKRRTDAGAKTPSPTIRSPEKRSAGWDLPPAETKSNVNGSVLPILQSSFQTVLCTTPDISKMVSVTSSLPVAVVGVSTASSPKLDTSVDSVQLTQATRPSRRLYIENLPAAVSEESVIACLNNFIFSTGGHDFQGTKPCISCIIHKEKNQALVEFLTPEDASLALSFDGKSFSGSVVKVRRPKDFSAASTGVSKKSVAEVGSISNTVMDSPHKVSCLVRLQVGISAYPFCIFADATTHNLVLLAATHHLRIFICGISKAISSDMLKEIACAFGPLKAYRYEVNSEINEPCAFLEYVDHTITYKACAGLNGMRLGGQVLTVVQAQDASQMENNGNSPSYEIPPHAKPLLEKPTQVLKLKNVIDPEYLLSISESELEEILEDVRLECTRFGTVKSVNIVKPSDHSMITQTNEVDGDIVSTMNGASLDCDRKETGTVVLHGAAYDSGEVRQSGPSSICNEHEELDTDVHDGDACDGKLEKSELSSQSTKLEHDDKVVEDNSISEDKPGNDSVKDQECQLDPVDMVMVVEDPTCQENSSAVPVENSNQLNTSIDQLEIREDVVEESSEKEVPEVENKSSVNEETKLEIDMNLQVVAYPDSDHSLRRQVEAHKDDENKEQKRDERNTFEPGCVLVEYRRTEASCMAAHCLHGRLFDERIVTVGYANLDLYRARFLK